MIVDQRLRWPIVGIGVRMAGPSRRGCPGSPAEERCKLANLFRITNGVWSQAKLRGGFSEERRVVGPALVESVRLSIGVHKRAGGPVVSICLEVLRSAASRRVG